MTPHEAFECARELVGVLLTGLAEIRKGDERQEFLDRAAIAMVSAGPIQPSVAMARAQELWQERERHRGVPSEREQVVRYLNLDLGMPAYGAAADAIKAGKHLEEPSG